MFEFLRKRPYQILTILLLGQAGLMLATLRSERPPEKVDLAGFPSTLGEWRMTHEFPMDPEVAQVLKADQTMNRQYQTPGRQSVSLFVAFFHSQRTGVAPHSPKNCLPGSGWVPMDARIGKMTVPGVDIPLEYNRYVVARGNDKSVVMYWYQSATRTIASEYWAKIFLVLDSVRYNRSDTALVRVVYPLREDGAPEVEAEVAEFVKTAFPVLRQALPH